MNTGALPFHHPVSTPPLLPPTCSFYLELLLMGPPEVGRGPWRGAASVIPLEVSILPWALPIFPLHLLPPCTTCTEGACNNQRVLPTRLSPLASPHRATHVEFAHLINQLPLGIWLSILFPPGKYSMHSCGYIMEILIPLSSQKSSLEDGAGIFICTFQISKMRLNLLGDLPRVIQLTSGRVLNRTQIFRLPRRNVCHCARSQSTCSPCVVQKAHMPKPLWH